MTVSSDTEASPTAALAERAFAASNYDFRVLFGIPGLMLERPHRRGVGIVVARTTQLPSAALDAIRAWRLGQYLLTGFYDPAVVAREDMIREPRADVHDGDVHGMAIDPDGGLCAYLTLKQPLLTDEGAAVPYSATDRPSFPCEEIHGRGWQKSIRNVDDINSRELLGARPFRQGPEAPGRSVVPARSVRARPCRRPPRPSSPAPAARAARHW